MPTVKKKAPAKKPVVKRVMLIERIRVELNCPHCGHDITVTHCTVGEISVCSICAKHFRISKKAEVRFPKLLRYFLIN